MFCPYGIDTAEITMAAKEIMDTIGLGQKYSNEIIGKVHKVGNNLGLPGPALLDTLQSIEEDLKEETGLDIRLPLDEKGAEVLLVTPSADFFAEPHVYSLIGYAKVFHAAGISWTLSTHASEAGNFGMFIGNYGQMQKIATRVREAALDLGVKRLVVGECGHAWRVAYSFWNTLIGPFDFLDPNYPVPQHICELTYDLIQRGAISSTRAPTTNTWSPSTIRATSRAPRAWATCRAASSRFRAPSSAPSPTSSSKWIRRRIREKTFCCGGGGGLLTDDLMDLRVKGALPRMEALQAGGRFGRRQLHGDHLRHLQGAVHQGSAVLQVQHEHGGRRAPTGEQRDPARTASKAPSRRRNVSTTTEQLQQPT